MEEKKQAKKIEKKNEKEKIDNEKETKGKPAEAKPEKSEEKKPKEEIKKEKKKKQEPKKPKKDFAIVNGKGLGISTKHAINICRFIKGKRLDVAVQDLEQVLKKKKAIPFRGEIAHKKGKGMMSGKYPEKASKQFIALIKSLIANANANGLELEKIKISEAVANRANRQLHRFGRTQFKRTHVLLKAEEIKFNRKKK